MRQWLVNPQMLCNQHILGEHVERHMIIGSIIKNRSIQGFIDKGLIDPKTLYKRHNQLVKEMQRRGMNHKSPLPIIELPNIEGKVDIENNIKDLKSRCKKCKQLIKELTI